MWKNRKGNFSLGVTVCVGLHYDLLAKTLPDASIVLYPQLILDLLLRCYIKPVHPCTPFLLQILGNEWNRTRTPLFRLSSTVSVTKCRYWFQICFYVTSVRESLYPTMQLPSSALHVQPQAPTHQFSTSSVSGPQLPSFAFQTCLQQLRRCALGPQVTHIFFAVYVLQLPERLYSR